MRLWAIAPAEAFAAVKRGKRLHNDRGRRTEYMWLCEQMKRRIEGYEGPSIWWAWYKSDGLAGQAPDAVQRDLLHHYPAGTPMVSLELVMSEREVLLSDHNLWRQLCADLDFLAFDAQEAAAFKQRFGKTPGSAERERVIASSWERIFTPSAWGRFDLTWLRDRTRPGHNIQATFEELREADIAAVTEFTSRAPGLLLPSRANVAV